MRPACRRCRSGRSRLRWRPGLDAVLVEQREHAERRPGVAGCHEEEAGVEGWKPSTSLTGSSARMTRPSSMPSGKGSWTRTPSTPSSAFSSATRSSSSRSVVVCGSRRSRASIRPRASRGAWRGCRRRAGSSPTGDGREADQALELGHVARHLGADPLCEGPSVHQRRRHSARISSGDALATQKRSSRSAPGGRHPQRRRRRAASTADGPGHAAQGGTPGAAVIPVSVVGPPPRRARAVRARGSQDREPARDRTRAGGGARPARAHGGAASRPRCRAA